MNQAVPLQDLRNRHHVMGQGVTGIVQIVVFVYVPIIRKVAQRYSKFCCDFYFVRANKLTLTRTYMSKSNARVFTE